MAGRPEGIPVKEVQTMRGQGVSDDKIVETLQRDGYLSSQIFDAMTQADMRPASEVKEVTDEFPDITSGVQGPPIQNIDVPSAPSASITVAFMLPVVLILANPKSDKLILLKSSAADVS